MKLILPLLLISAVVAAQGQIPVTVSRSTVENGGSVVLPAWSSTGKIFPQHFKSNGNFTPTSSGLNTFSQSENVTVQSAIITASPSSIIAPNFTIDPQTWPSVSATANVTVLISQGAPSQFSAIITGTAIYTNPFEGDTGAYNFSQEFSFTIVDDGLGTTTSQVNLNGESGGIQTVSRKSETMDPSVLIAFQLQSNVSATVHSLALTLSNTTPGDSQNFEDLQLVEDINRNGLFDASDSVLGSTLYQNGFAPFEELNLAITTEPKSLLLVAKFDPSKQSRNSFLSASLKSQNLLVTEDSTGDPILVNSGTVYGTQYAFLDSTAAEDEEEKHAVDLRISKAIQNSLSGLNTTVLSGSNNQKLDSSDSIFPAVISGAVAIGAAFTSDALNHSDPEPLEDTSTETLP